MFTKKNKKYADVGKRIKMLNIPAYMLSTTLNNVEEINFKEPYKVEVKDKKLYFSELKFEVSITNTSYDAIKTALINSRYSNDDQIAIILNKDDSEEGALLFNKMQEWREYSGELAKKAIESLS